MHSPQVKTQPPDASAHGAAQLQPLRNLQVGPKAQVCDSSQASMAKHTQRQRSSNRDAVSQVDGDPARWREANISLSDLSPGLECRFGSRLRRVGVADSLMMVR